MLDRKKFASLTTGFGILILLVVMIFVRSTVRHAPHIELSPTTDFTEGVDGGESDDPTMLSLIEITPDTVQTAIASMKRLTIYSRSVSVVHYWSSGSQQVDMKVYVDGSLTRIDTAKPDGSLRHALTNGEYTAVWYNYGTQYEILSASLISADMEQQILTYEDVLDAPEDAVLDAAYEQYEGRYAIKVTIRQNIHTTTTYWISTETGLLIGAETYEDDVLVYTMKATSIDAASPSETVFLLPDGQQLDEYTKPA